MHLAGPLATQVDQQKQNGNSNQAVELASAVLILIILLLVFRALLAPLVTLLPAGLAVAISGPLVGEAAEHGLKVSFLAQILLTVLVLARARTTTCSWCSASGSTYGAARRPGRRW